MYTLNRERRIYAAATPEIEFKSSAVFANIELRKWTLADGWPPRARHSARKDLMTVLEADVAVDLLSGSEAAVGLEVAAHVLDVVDLPARALDVAPQDLAGCRTENGAPAAPGIDDRGSDALERLGDDSQDVGRRDEVHAVEAGTVAREAGLRGE